MEVTPQKIFELQVLLHDAVKSYRKRGEKMAKAEHDYRIGLATKILELRSESHPATLIGDLARGNKEIAALKLERDIAEAMYKSSQEAINSYKLQIRVLENQIEREWSQAKRS